MNSDLKFIALTAAGTILGVFALRFINRRPMMALPSPTGTPAKHKHHKNAVLSN